MIALIGGLGAGKTHWTKGLVAGLGSAAEVTSPTFGLVHEYPGGRLPVFHLDFYRLENAGELIALGWDEYLEADGVIIAEWGDKFPDLLPAGTVRFYQRDRKGSPQFIGENGIGHTPMGSELSLRTGDAFDIFVQAGGKSKAFA